MKKADLLARLKIIQSDKDLRLASVTTNQLFLALSALELDEPEPEKPADAPAPTK